MTYLTLAAVAASLTLTPTAHAANIWAQPRPAGYGSYIFIFGQINYGDDQKFATLNPPSPNYVRPKGPDGNVDAAIKIADMIHDRGYSTLVANRDYDLNGFHGSASACSIIWLSGSHVLVQNSAYRRFHSCASPEEVYVDGNGGNYKDSLGCDAMIYDHLIKYGYTNRQAQFLANAGPHETSVLGTKWLAHQLGFRWQTIPSWYPGAEDQCQAKFCLAFP